MAIPYQRALLLCLLLDSAADSHTIITDWRIPFVEGCMNVVSPNTFQSWCRKCKFVINITNMTAVGYRQVVKRLVICTVCGFEVILEIFLSKRRSLNYGILTDKPDKLLARDL
jgi:hypothetical protein